MLVIRLARGGRTKYPVYRIVAAESSRAATGKFVEVLGHYNPHTKELVIKKEETVKRLSHGAQPSNSVIRLLQQEKIELPSWVKLQTKSRKPKNAPDEPEVAETPETSEEAAAETPAEDQAAEVESTERVAEAATEAAAEVEPADPDANKTETAADTEAAADAAKEASDTAAEVATPEAKSDDK